MAGISTRRGGGAGAQQSPRCRMKPRTLFVAIAVALGVLVVGLPSVLDPAVTTKSPGSTPNGVPPPKAGATDGDVDGKGSQTIRRPAENRSHHCLNDDFAPEHAVGIWTMLSDNPDYVKGAVKMGRSVRRHTKTPHDLVVMEIESKPLGKESWDLLSSVGFKRCSVKSIPPPKPDKTRRDLREKFGVLHVWAMTVYDTVLFIDADTFVQNGLDDLLGMDLEGKTIGVTKDIRAKKWVDTFNSGVLLLHPSAGEYDRLHKLLYSGMEFEYIMSDQGFLNEVYKDDWKEIGFVNNANLALYRFQRAFWDEHKLEDINIVHYTMQKPWKCQPRGPYGPICKLWIDAE